MKLSENLLRENYQNLDKSLEHFGDLPSKCRLLGSSWLIFGLGAIGYVLKEILIESQFQEEVYLVGIIGFMMGLGMSVILTMDLLVYQEMLGAVYIEKRALESANPWLPQTANNIRIVLKGKGRKLISRYYYFSIGLSFWLGGAGLILSWKVRPVNDDKECFFYTALLIWTIIILVLIYILNRRIKGTNEIERESGLYKRRKKHYLNYSSKFT